MSEITWVDSYISSFKTKELSIMEILLSICEECVCEVVKVWVWPSKTPFSTYVTCYNWLLGSLNCLLFFFPMLGCDSFWAGSISPFFLQLGVSLILVGLEPRPFVSGFFGSSQLFLKNLELNGSLAIKRGIQRGRREKIRYLHHVEIMYSITYRGSSTGVVLTAVHNACFNFKVCLIGCQVLVTESNTKYDICRFSALWDLAD